jgi:RNA polymerase sigma-70 factor (ECF subfamily)
MKPIRKPRPDEPYEEDAPRDADDDRLPAPRGITRSGVCRRAGLPVPDEAPCATVEEVFRRYRGFVWAGILRRLGNDRSAAEDLLQQVFVRLLRRTLHDKAVPDPIAPVLLGLTDDVVRDLRRHRRRHPRDDAPDSKLPTSKPDPEQLVGRAEMCRRLQSVLPRMRPEEQALLQLSSEDELSPAEIAGTLGVTPGSVRGRLHRAREKLAGLLTHHLTSRRRR